MLAASRKPVRRSRNQSPGLAKLSQCDWRNGVPASLSMPKRVFVNCHYCAYSPQVIPADGMCPKCGGSSWHRYALSQKAMEPRD